MANIDVIQYLTTVPNYGWKKGTTEHWEKYHNILNDINWCEMTQNLCLTDKVRMFMTIVENAVSESFDNLVEKKSEKKRIPKHIKKLFAKKTILSRKLMKSKSGRKVSDLKDQIEVIENEIKVSMEKVRRNFLSPSLRQQYLTTI